MVWAGETGRRPPERGMRAQVGGWQASAKAAVSSAAGVAAAKVEGGGAAGVEAAE